MRIRRRASENNRSHDAADSSAKGQILRIGVDKSDGVIEFAGKRRFCAESDSLKAIRWYGRREEIDCDLLGGFRVRAGSGVSPVSPRGWAGIWDDYLAELVAV